MTLVDLSNAKRYRELAERMIEVEVVKARHAGFTWQQIGTALGITHQGARARWAKAVQGVARTNGAGAESANGVRDAPDHPGRVDGDPVVGPGIDGD